MQTLKTETRFKLSCHQLQAQKEKKEKKRKPQKHRSNLSLSLVKLIKKFKYHFDRVGLYIHQININ